MESATSRRSTGGFRKKKKMVVAGANAHVDETMDVDIDGPIQSDVATIKKKKKKVSAKKPTVTLSFADEDDDEEGAAILKATKKTATAAKFNKRAKSDKLLSSKQRPVAQTSSGGSYSAAGLAALVQENKVAPAPHTVDYGGDDLPLGGDVAVAPTTLPSDDCIISKDEIYAARKRREQARKQSEFIPLDDNRGKSSNSRLVREEQEDSDEEAKMSFGEAARRTNSVNKRERLKQALKDQDDADEDDPEFQEWERKQILILTGGSGGQQPVNPIAGRNIHSHSHTNSNSNRANPISHTVSAGALVEQLCRSLGEKLSTVEERVRSDESHLARAESDLKISQDTMGPLEEDLKDATARYNFYQELKGYTRNMLKCLDTKRPAIIECKNQLHMLWKEKADATSERYEQHRQDMYERASLVNTPKFDNFGRDISEHMRQARERRIEQRRTRGKRRRLNAPQPLVANNDTYYNDPECMLSTDDEEEEQVLRERSDKQREILDKSSLIFSDVLTEFCEVKKIAARFENWKRMYPDTYRNAYAGDSLRKILIPVIDLEILSWNPLEPQCPNIEDAKWFKEFVATDFAACDEQDPDYTMVPDLVESVYLPKLSGLLEFVWNPRSTSQSTRVRDLLNTLVEEEYVAKDSKALQVLLASVVSRWKQVVTSRMQSAPVPMENAPMEPDNIYSLLQQDLLIVHALVKWEKWLSISIIQDLVLKLVLGRIVPYVKRAHMSEHLVYMVEQVVFSIPSTWIGGKTAAAAAINLALDPLQEYIRSLLPHTSMNVTWHSRLTQISKYLAGLK